MLRLSAGLSAFLGVFLLSLHAQAQHRLLPRLALEEKWTNVFGGKEVDVHLKVEADEKWAGRLSWTFSVGPAVSLRKEVALQVDRMKPARLTVRLPFPEVRAGVTLDASLNAILIADNKEVGSLSQKYFIYPTDAFADRITWLKSINIRVYDPSNKTSDLLKKAGVPFEPIVNLDAPLEPAKAVLIVGEGMSFREDRGAPDLLWKKAASGASVLCLAPADGSISVVTAGQSGPNSLAFFRSEKVQALDKKIDPEFWLGNVRAAVNGVKLHGEGQDVVADVIDHEGWPWMEARFSSGRLLICGLGIVRHWDSSPAPRFLLARILENFAPDSGSKSLEK